MIWVIIFQSAVSASRKSLSCRLHSQLCQSSSFLSLNSPTILPHFGFCSLLTTSPIWFWRLAQIARPISCPALTTVSYFLPLGCLPVCPPLSMLLPTFLFASSGHKCLRHSTRVLDAQVLICPSQDQVHSEVRELILLPFFQPFVDISYSLHHTVNKILFWLK